MREKVSYYCHLFLYIHCTLPFLPPLSPFPQHLKTSVKTFSLVLQFKVSSSMCFLLANYLVLFRIIISRCPYPTLHSVFPMCKSSHRNFLDQIVPSLGSSLNSSPRSDLDSGVERFSRKVFVGGLPPDIDEGKMFFDLFIPFYSCRLFLTSYGQIFYSVLS